MAEEWAFFEGDYVSISEAKVSIKTHALNYGTGAFEGIRGYWNEDAQQMYLFRVREHFERLHRSARILRMNLGYSVDELVDIAVTVAVRNKYRTDVYIRPVVYTSTQIVGLGMARRTDSGIEFFPDDFFLFAVPFGDYLDVNKPIRCGVCSWQRIDDNMIPARAKATGIYINSALARTEAEENGFDEAIMLTASGHVSEGSGENIFVVSNGSLITPSPSENILEGITRATVMQLAKDEFGLETIERPVDRTELYTADELFLCGTGAQISAVSHVDNRLVGSGDIGPITKDLMKLYFDVVKGKHPKYVNWCTSVYPSSLDATASKV